MTTDDDIDPDEPVEIELGDELDLHAFAPADVRDLVSDYLDDCAARGFEQVRIIHGKGTGTLRRIVHGVLDAHPAVERYALDSGRGSWGATVVRLRPSGPPEAPAEPATDA